MLPTSGKIIYLTGCITGYGGNYSMSGSYLPLETEERKTIRILEEKRVMKEKISKFKKFSLTSDSEPPILNR